MLNLFSLSLSPSLPLSTPPLPSLSPSTYFLLPFSPSSIFPFPPLPPYLPSLPLFLHLPSYLSQSLTQSLTSLFNISHYFPYLDHSLLPHSTMLFTVLSCMFNISHYFPYLDHSLLPHSTMLFTVLSCVFNFLQYFPYLDHSFLLHSTMLFTVLSCVFNFLQYFPYLDHSLLPHSTMLFTVLSCVFNISHYFLLFRSLFSLTQPCCSLYSLACSIFHIIFSYLDHLELYIKVRLNTRPSYQRQQKFGRGPVVHKTRVLRGTSNPQWREDFMVRGPQ